VTAERRAEIAKKTAKARGILASLQQSTLERGGHKQYFGISNCNIILSLSQVHRGTHLDSQRLTRLPLASAEIGAAEIGAGDSHAKHSGIYIHLNLWQKVQFCGSAFKYYFTGCTLRLARNHQLY